MNEQESKQESGYSRAEDVSRVWFQRKDAYLAAFLVPVLVMIIIFADRGIFPFGDRSFLRTDMYHQYAPFFSEFHYKLTSGGSLLYSWDVGMGINFAALYAYYLASPLNWLVALCPKAYVLEFMTYMVVLKIGFCGLGMTAYLSRHAQRTSFAPAFFGIFYALSGYIAAYSWNIMWLDCIALFPLICLGLERLVRTGRGLFYCVTLGLCILSNYYISIMVCISLVIYFFMLLILEEPGPFARYMAAAGRFAFYSLLAGCLAAVVLLPEIFALQSTASASMSFPKTVTEYFSVIDVLARHMINVGIENGLDHWPNIYCGVAAYPLVILWLLNRKISLKEKAVYSIVLLFFIAGFSLNIPNYIWHGMHYPNSLPARQSFVYIFLVLFVCFRAVDRMDGSSPKQLGAACLSSAAFILLCQKLIDDDAFSWDIYYASLAFLLAYCLLLHLYQQRKMGLNLLIFLTILLTAVESEINMTVTSVTTVTRSKYLDDNADVRQVISNLDDSGFYRMEKVTRKTKDDGAWMNFPSVSLFSSTAKKGLTSFFKNLGCEASTNAYSITGATPLVDSLLSVKYGIYTGPSDNEMLEFVDQSGEICLYENPFVLPLGYTINLGMTSNWVIDMGNPVRSQNGLCDLMLTPHVLNRMEGELNGNTLDVEATGTGLYYAYSDSTQTDTVRATIGGSFYKDFEKLNRGFFMELGIVEKGSKISLQTTDGSANNVKVYRFDYNALSKLVNKLGANPLQISWFDDTHIVGSFDAAANQLLFLTVPYDEGWTIIVDGAEVKPMQVFGAFLGVRVPKGHHEIAMSYQPEGLLPGAAISGAALLLVLMIGGMEWFRYRKRRKELLQLQQEDAEDLPSRGEPEV